MKYFRKQSLRNRLVGALGGAGGTLVLAPLLNYLLLPGIWNVEVSIVFEVIGVLLIVLGIIVYQRK